jgi:hypothetical protein
MKVLDNDKGEETRSLLGLSEAVPDFEAVSTHGKTKLSD